MRTPRQLASLLAAAVVTSVAAASAGCASGGSYAYDTARVEAQRMALRVTNENWSDVRIYLVREGSSVPQRIGSVAAFSTRVMRLRPQVTGWTRLMIVPLASNTVFTTEPVNVAPGQGMELTVQNHLPLSFLVIR